MAMLCLNNITKSYGKVEALKGVTLSIDEGEIFGLIGPDGAGKSTLFRIMGTLLLSDAGECSIDSLDVVRNYKEIRKIIGYMPGAFHSIKTSRWRKIYSFLPPPSAPISRQTTTLWQISTSR